MPRGRPAMTKNWELFKTKYRQYLIAKQKYSILKKEYNEAVKLSYKDESKEVCEKIDELSLKVAPFVGTLWNEWKRLASDIRHLRRSINNKIVKRLIWEVKENEIAQ